MLTSLLTAFLISCLIVGLAYWRGSLSTSGAGAALVVGTLTFGLGGWRWGILLGVFFVSSSLLSHFKEDEKQRTAEEKFDKGHTRDAGQVAANGGVGTLIAVLSALFPSPLWFPLFLGVMGTVTADTWATELGTLAKKPPRLITTGRVVEPGTSGGITLLGTAVSLVGGLIIGLAAWAVSLGGWELLLLGGLGGLAGSLTDSLLGATVQQLYYSEALGKETERKIDKTGAATRPLRGWRWMSNDMVNAISSLVGGITAVIGTSLIVP